MTSPLDKAADAFQRDMDRAFDAAILDSKRRSRRMVTALLLIAATLALLQLAAQEIVRVVDG